MGCVVSAGVGHVHLSNGHDAAILAEHAINCQSVQLLSYEQSWFDLFSMQVWAHLLGL